MPTVGIAPRLGAAQRRRVHALFGGRRAGGARAGESRLHRPDGPGLAATTRRASLPAPGAGASRPQKPRSARGAPSSGAGRPAERRAFSRAAGGRRERDKRRHGGAL
jgi:hypothetical protein